MTEPAPEYVDLLVYPYEVHVGDLFPDDYTADIEDVVDWFPVTAVTTVLNVTTITLAGPPVVVIPKAARRTILTIRRPIDSV